MLRLHHYDDLNTARAINFSCYRRQSLLRSPDVIMAFLAELDGARQRYGFHILGYVVMPSHVHLVLHPPAGTEMGRVIGVIKARSSGRILRAWREADAKRLSRLSVHTQGRTEFAFWQRRCYDHNCRGLESVRGKINYCHLNPVRAGLVAEPGDWRWSSYRWYHDMVDVVLDIDGIEL
jgi:REP-associated tyrosine transposase